jgi:hypothetical protein
MSYLPPFSKRNPQSSPSGGIAAADDAQQLFGNAHELVNGSLGTSWYSEHGGAADRAALALCRLRRARAGERGGPEQGDDGVRAALEQADPAAVIWLASRAVSYMDENGFPEAVEPWFPE